MKYLIFLLNILFFLLVHSRFQQQKMGAGFQFGLFVPHRGAD